MHWISVDTSLPTQAGKYRIKGFNGSVNPKPFEVTAMFKMYPYGGKFLYGFDWCRITHWREL